MWQRFTERARRIIMLGQEEAVKMNSGYVGTEHLLLGVLRDQERISALLLSDLGITLDVVRPLVVAPPPTSEAGGYVPQKKWFGSPPSQEPKLTRAAKHVLELAAEEARHMKDRDIGADHVLLGLLRDSDTSVAQILRQQGFQMEALYAHVLKYLSPEDTSPKTLGPDIVVGNKAGWLLAVLENEHWSAIQILAESGLDVAAARQKLQEQLEENQPEA